MSVILFKNFGKKRQRLLSLAHSFFFFKIAQGKSLSYFTALDISLTLQPGEQRDIFCFQHYCLPRVKTRKLNKQWRSFKVWTIRIFAPESISFKRYLLKIATNKCRFFSCRYPRIAKASGKTEKMMVK